LHRFFCLDVVLLLKNNGLLPLKKDGLRTIAVVGPVGRQPAVLEGNYNGISSRYTTFLEGVREVFAGSAQDVRAGHAILWAGYPGQAGGKALANILLGEVSPSGKLPITFYRNEDPLPEFTDYSMKNCTYRYHEAQALYPFGYGLSYASFTYSDAAYEAAAARVTIRNEGSVDAEEIVQVYVKADSKDAPRNPRLSGFRRVALKAGEEKRVLIPLDHDLFTVIDCEGTRYRPRLPCSISAARSPMNAARSYWAKPR